MRNSATIPRKIKTNCRCRLCGLPLYAYPAISDETEKPSVESPNPWFPYCQEAEQNSDRLQMRLACEDENCWIGTYSTGPEYTNTDRGRLVEPAREYVYERIHANG